MIQKLKCLLGFHKKELIAFQRPFFKNIIMKCEYCGKYNFYNYEEDTNHWTNDINEFPEEVSKLIIKSKV